MILNPAIIALITSSLLIVAYAIYASAVGYQIIRWWDIQSGSERQLNLERKTYLISTVMVYMFGFGLFSLLLFIYTADHVHDFFIGAMCAAGSLNVNKFGYPAVMVTDTVFYRTPHYHRMSDKPETLDYKRCAQVVDGLAFAVNALA